MGNETKITSENIKKMLIALSNVETAIADNNQNIKDAIVLFEEIRIALGIQNKKKGLISRLRNFLFTK